MKRLLSMILVVALIISAFPLSNVNATDTETSDFVVDNDHKDTTTISGDAVNGYTMTLTGEGRTRILSTQKYPVSTLSFDFGYQYTGDSFGEFGISTTPNITDLDHNYSIAEKRLTFFYRIAENKLRIAVRWPNGQEVLIGLFDHKANRPDEVYSSTNVSNFSFVGVDGHWHLAVDGNICNYNQVAHSNLEYAMGQLFDNNTEVYPYVGGYNSGTVYYKNVNATDTETSDFVVDAEHKDTTTISGDAVNGYTMTLTGEERTRILSTQKYQVSTLSFDFGYTYSGNQYGEFGVSTTPNITDLDVSNSIAEKRLTFNYRIAENKLRISVRWPNGQEVLIGLFDYETYRPGDAYSSTNVSNFSFVKVDGHWHLVVDGNICNYNQVAHSNLEYAMGQLFDNNTEVYPYVGGYGSGTVYYKQLSAPSADGMWESRAVDSYIHTVDGVKHEYRGYGNTSETVHSAIPKAAEGSAKEGHIVDFTGTDGYAQTVSGYDLKTTTFHISPVTSDGNTDNIWFYLGFTANPAAFQYHSVKPGDTIELYAASVYSSNYTGGWFNTNPAGCYADAGKDNISFGRFGQWRTHRYADNYSSASLHLNFIQDVGADGNRHWYMQTTVSGTAIVIKSADVNKDKYMQFDSIIDKPVYFRMGTHGGTASVTKMYCQIEEGTEAAAIETIYQNLDLGNFAIDYEDGATMNEIAYQKGDSISQAGTYELKYEESGEKYNRQMILYRPGDVTVDNVRNIRDLVRLKKYLTSSAELDVVGTKSADVNLSDKIDEVDLTFLRKTLVSDDTMAVTGYTRENMEELVDFTVEVESGREMRVLQLTDPQIMESEQQRVSGRLDEVNAERYKKANKDEMYHKYLTDAITKSNPDLILVTGDLVYGEFDDNGEAFAEFVEFMDSFKIPWAPIFGNHENESKIGVDEQCKLLVKSEYALFEQRTLTGNGNYTVGLKQDGEYKRVYFMLDSNGCANASAESLANGHTSTSIGFGEDQIAWYLDLAEKMRYCVPDLKLSAAFHIQLSVFEKAYAQYGFNQTNFTEIDLDSLGEEGAFGYIGRNFANPWDEKENVWYGLKCSGFDSFYVGHVHRISASAVYRGVRFQFGQKSSTYDEANYRQEDGTISSNFTGNVTPIIGGTTIPVNQDGSLGIGKLVLYGEEGN